MSWWRRNRIALIALAVIVPLAFAILPGVQILDDRIYAPEADHTIPFGEPAEALGFTVTVEQTVDAREGVPADMSVVAMLVHVELPQGVALDDYQCTAVLTDDGPGGTGERSWDVWREAGAAGWPYQDDTEQFCHFGNLVDVEDFDGTSIDFEFVYYVPPGTYDQATLEFAISEFDIDAFGTDEASSGPIIPPLRFALDYDRPPDPNG